MTLTELNRVPGRRRVRLKFGVKGFRIDPGTVHETLGCEPE